MGSFSLEFLTNTKNLTGINVSGNINTITDGDDYKNVEEARNFNSIFENCNWTFDGLKLPATKTTQWCYSEMFKNCINLTSIPEGLLPALTLNYSCYAGMF
ncbi:MAG: hypothetical protein PUJ51_10300 [Clostridiales bacterium]|nr:hypothetical protein [Clostridiales bacterium]